MSQSWMVTVDGQAYGPYPIEQMKAFVAEGRVLPQSLVNTPGEAEPYLASEDPVLAPLFQPAEPVEPIEPAEPEFQAPRAALSEPPAQSGFGRHRDISDGELRHYLIIADMKSRSIIGLEETIFNLGQAVPLMPQAWLLTSTRNINVVRSTLVQKLGTVDVLFVADTTHDKAAWHNFGPEVDARIRRVWDKATQRKSA